ncbi:YhcN/YlaJ family sporulation lipoprotein [Alicyclobacillus dauci]|uniref:YhcN/YlaJ family sporulation lipoprotein n=1 Tax=Alicyclobacillus dauci TaxID=1475485 RepID=A0ABY6Z854_9BACL|nr:YhcN/YlaJ family sporulation lipoprotein [Alicyclobacillus dauci]WAH39075.1 YhcN/YlaJ family sporulation lipoprotein [Alicyclobacillus dauci]
MKKRLGLAGIAFVAFVLTGCGANTNNGSKPAADVMNATNRVTNGTVNRVTNGAARLGDRNHFQMATKIANGLVKAGYAKNAFAFVTGNTAYVAITQKGPAKTNMTMQEKNRIAASVKRMDKRIQTVYVSANPDVYQRFQSFAKDMQAGKPVAAIWNNFSTTVARMFPTAH